MIPCDKKSAKQDKLVKWDKKKMKNSYKVWCFQVQKIWERLESFSESHFIFVATIWEEEKECVHFLYVWRQTKLFRLNIFDSENF